VATLRCCLLVARFQSSNEAGHAVVESRPTPTEGGRIQRATLDARNHTALSDGR